MFAYFITFTCYGTHLLGEKSGSVDSRTNEFAAPFVEASVQRRNAKERLLEQEPYVLDKLRREIVLAAICETAEFRGWQLEAVHIRTNHVHIVVRASEAPEKVMNDFKSYASRRLNEAKIDLPDRIRWTRHGSTRHLWSEEAIAQKVRYTVLEQGELLAIYVRGRIGET